MRFHTVSVALICAAFLSACGGEGSAVIPSGSTPPPVLASKAATLNWSQPMLRGNGDPLNGVSGYTVYFGTAEDAMDNMILIDDPTVTRYTTGDLEPGTYYFAVSASDADGREGARTATLSKVIE